MSASWNQGPLITSSGGSYAWVPAKAAIYDQMVKDYGLDKIVTGIAARQDVLKADPQGRLRMYRASQASLIGIPDPARTGALRDGLGRMLLPGAAKP
jgi:hypothetical protein